MANIFDQFDEKPAENTSNIFDQFDSSTPQEPKMAVSKQENPIDSAPDPMAVMHGSEPLENTGSQTPRQAWETVGKPTIELGALSAGGIIGTAAAGPIGGVAGAGLLYGQAKAATNIIDNLIKKYAKEPIPDDNVKGELLRSLGDVRDGMTFHMMGESTGKAIVGTANMFLAPGSSKMVQAAEAAARSQAERQGIKLSPGEATGSKTMLQAEAMMSNSPAASDIVRTFALKQQLEPIMAKRRELMETTAANPRDIDALGRQIYKEVNDYLVKREGLKGKALEEMRARVIGELGSEDTALMTGLNTQERILAESQIRVKKKNELYDAATDAVKAVDSGKAAYEFPSMKKTAEELLFKYEKLPKTTLSPETRDWLNWAAGKETIHPSVKKRLAELPEELHEQVLATMRETDPEFFSVKKDLESLTFARQELNRLIAANNPALKQGVSGFKGQLTPEGYIYTELKSAVEKDWRAIVESTGGEAKKALDIADAFYVENIQEGVRKSIIKKTAYSDPGKIVDLAFNKGSITDVNTLKKFIGDEKFIELRGQFTNKIAGLDKGAFDPAQLQNNLKKYGNEFLQSIYNPEELRFLRETARRGLDLATLKLPGDAFARSLANKTPEVIVDAVVGAPESKIQSNILYQNILNIKKVVSEDTFRNIGDKVVEKLFQVSPTTGYLPPETFARTVNKYTGTSDYGRNVLEAFGFSKDKISKLKELAESVGKMSTSQRIAANPSGTAQNIITWGSLGMVLRDPIRGIPVVLAPRMMAKIWYSPSGMKWLTDGFKLPVGSQEGVSTAIKLMGIINSDEIREGVESL